MAIPTRLSDGEVVKNPEKMASGQDKVKLYGWTLADEPGQHKMIHKNDIVVDPSYQRHEIRQKVLAIAQNWSWMGCGVILIGHRAGRNYAYDGNHRVLAARTRSDIVMLPCQVFQTVSAEQEAAGFIRANVLRKPLKAMEKFNAMVLVGDKAAVLANQLVEGSGYRFTSCTGDGRDVKCIGAIIRAAERDAEGLTHVWPLLVELAKGGPVLERVFESVLYLETRLREHGVSLYDKPWKDRLLRLGSDGVRDAGTDAARFFKNGGAKIWATGLLQALNRGVRNKLSFEGVVRPEEEGAPE